MNIDLEKEEILSLIIATALNSETRGKTNRTYWLDLSEKLAREILK